VTRYSFLVSHDRQKKEQVHTGSKEVCGSTPPTKEGGACASQQACACHRAATGSTAHCRGPVFR
jgi:hypothetical protein